MTFKYGDKIPEDMILGHIVLFSISDPKITHSQLITSYVGAGLDSNLIPSAPRKTDAFKRACRYSEMKNVPITGTDLLANILIRKVDNSKLDHERQIVIEVVDSDNKRLDYKPTLRLQFDKMKSTVHYIDLDLTYPELHQLATDRFKDEFDKALKFIDPQVLRLMVRKQLDRSHGTLIKRGGSVYFLSKGHAATVEGLETFFETLNGQSMFHSIPLLDTEKQRDLIRLSLEEGIHDEATSILINLKDVVAQKKKITPGQFEAARDRFNVLSMRTKEYGELVSDEMQKARLELRMLQASIMQVLNEGLVGDK